MNAFSHNVVTVDGARLIAQATAANQIVFVGGLSSDTAASSDAELSTKPVSWYTGKGGEIAAVSANGSVARCIITFRNSGQRQSAKSLAITARLASQTDAQAVVLAAISDSASPIELPGEDDIGQAVEVPFNIDIHTAGAVEVVPGTAAGMGDLARFVSMYKAGDPTTGEKQKILGEKVFDGKIHAGLIAADADISEDPQYRQLILTGGPTGSGDALVAISVGYNRQKSYNEVIVGSLTESWHVHGKYITCDSATASIGTEADPIGSIYADTFYTGEIISDRIGASSLDVLGTTTLRNAYPNATDSYDLGSVNYRWARLFCGTGIFSVGITAPSISTLIGSGVYGDIQCGDVEIKGSYGIKNPPSASLSNASAEPVIRLGAIVKLAVFSDIDHTGGILPGTEIYVGYDGIFRLRLATANPDGTYTNTGGDIPSTKKFVLIEGIESRVYPTNMYVLAYCSE